MRLPGQSPASLVTFVGTEYDFETLFSIIVNHSLTKLCRPLHTILIQ